MEKIYSLAKHKRFFESLKVNAIFKKKLLDGSYKNTITKVWGRGKTLMVVKQVCICKQICI